MEGRIAAKMLREAWSRHRPGSEEQVPTPGTKSKGNAGTVVTRLPSDRSGENLLQVQVRKRMGKEVVALLRAELSLRGCCREPRWRNRIYVFII